jgi:hypothetical protein
LKDNIKTGDPGFFLWDVGFIKNDSSGISGIIPQIEPAGYYAITAGCFTGEY